MQKTSAVSQTAAQEAASTAEKTKQEEIKLVLEKYSIAAQREKEALIMQVCTDCVWCKCMSWCVGVIHTE